MTRTQYTKAIELELSRLNKSIDSKILKGERYAIESKKHKILLQKILSARASRAQTSPSIFSRLLLALN